MTIEASYRELSHQLNQLYDQREAMNIAGLAIEFITGKGNTDRIIDKNALLSQGQEEQFQTITKALLSHQPIQYILGEAWFAGMKFFVDKNVLIPRPETEELVDWIVGDAGLPAGRQDTGCGILDIGSGSGCIPIALKKKIKNSVITSIDVSEDALQVAKKNALTLGVEVNFLLIDFLDENNWNQLPVFDIIVSNPPYIKQSESNSMSKHVLDAEPHIALFVPDEDALLFYRKIAAFGKTHLNPKGRIFVEINEALSKEVITLFEKEGYRSHIKKDLQGKDRMVQASF